MSRARFARRERRSRPTPAASAAVRQAAPPHPVPLPLKGARGRTASSLSLWERSVISRRELIRVRVIWKFSFNQRRVRAAAALAFVLALAVLVSGFGDGAQAQTAACSENSGTVSGVECIEPATSDRDIDIRQDGTTISTTGDDDHGIHGWKKGSTGDIDIDVNRSTVTTTGVLSHGVRGRHDGTGTVVIDVRDSTVTTTDGHGIYASDSEGLATGNDADIVIDIRDSAVTTGSSENHGVFGSINAGTGDLRVDLRNTDVITAGSLSAGVKGLVGASVTGKLSIAVTGGSSVSTTGDGAPGIEGRHGGAGDIDIDVKGSTVTTTGGEGTGNSIPHGVYGHHDGTGDIDIDVAGSTVDVSTGHGIFGRHESDGDIRLRVRDSTVTGTGVLADSLLGMGIYGWLSGVGDIVVDVSGSFVTGADLGYGIVGRHEGTGAIDLRVRATTVLGSGDNGHGIYGYHEGTGDIGIAISGGSSVLTSGENARGVYGQHGGAGDINIAISGSSVRTSGDTAEGVVGWHSDDGDINIVLRSSTVISDEGRGVAAYHNHGDQTNAGDIDIDIAGSTVTAKFHGVYGYHNSAGDIGIDVTGSTVTVSGAAGYGVFGWHQDRGDIVLRVRNSKITTSGSRGRGVFASHFQTDGFSAGDIVIDVSGTAITTTGGSSAYGVYGFHNGEDGGIDISVRGGSSVSTSAASAHGIYARHAGSALSDIAVTVADSAVTTSGAGARGVYARRQTAGGGDIDILVRGGTIRTVDHGVYALNQGADDEGAIRIRVRGTGIRTSGATAHGVYASFNHAEGSAYGDIDIHIAGGAITTTGTGAAHGVYGYHNGWDGGIRISVTGGSSVSTSGAGAHGIFAWHDGTAYSDMAITVADSAVTASGAGSRGIYALRGGSGLGSSGDIDILVRGSTIRTTSHGIYVLQLEGSDDGAVRIGIRDSDIRASGAGAHGVAVGGLSTNGNTLFATTSRDDDGYRKQSVWADGRVYGGSGTGAGIYLAGGGRVIIGPNGRVGAASGVAIRAAMRAGQASADDPKLYVGLRPEGRRIGNLLGGNIVNEGGASRTTLSVNGVVLMDAGIVAAGVWVPNGAWDVALSADANGANVAAADFLDRFAPRAAVYEALPGILLRLDAPGGMGGPWGGESLLRSADTPIWARIAGGQGSYEPASATVGAEYEHDRFSVESGMDFRLPYEGLSGWAGVRVVSGSAKISSPAGGGRIEARGYGVAGGVAWEGEDGLYGRGRLSLTRYNADLSSETRGGLKNGVTGTVHALDLEGGRRFNLDLAGMKTRLTARGLLRRAGVAMGEFEDGLFSRVSVEKADRLAAGAGVDIETGLLPRDGVDRLRLRGSLDAAQVLSGGTKVDVSGTELESKAGGTRLGAGLGAAYRMGGYTIGGAVGAAGLGSGDTSYSGRLEARIAF